MNSKARKIKLSDLKDFCRLSLTDAGMAEEDARITAEVLAETDAYGTNSHGTKNLPGYIRKAKAGGLDIKAVPEIIRQGPAFAIIDAKNSMGTVSSWQAMELACAKAKETGVGLVTVKNSTHFGAAGYYANMAALKGMFGIAMSNVDPNMTVPGARGMLIGNNPFAYAAPAGALPSVFLDIAMSNVASLKVIQAKKDGLSIPDTWIVDKDGLPTTNPAGYPDEGAMQPMAAHKGYGLAVFVELLTGGLSGGGMSMLGDIVSWLFEMDKPNNVCHTFIAIDIEKFTGREAFVQRTDDMIKALQDAEKAKGKDRIYLPGEIEWNKHRIADDLLQLPSDVAQALSGLAADNNIKINWAEAEV